MRAALSFPQPTTPGKVVRCDSRQREALRVNGCGIDVGFQAVYTLAGLVLGDGNALNQRWL